MMAALPLMRTLLNKYRLASGTLALTGLLFAGGALQQSLTYDVDMRAVARRNILRDHYDKDLTTPIATIDPEYLSTLEGRTTRMNPGGLLYVNDGQLAFYPITPTQAGPKQDMALNLATFQSLFSALSRGATQEFLERTRQPAVSGRLQNKDLSDMLGIVQERGLSDGRGKSAARVVIREFVPYGGETYELSRGDELRFYKDHQPKGAYVGAWEFLGFGEGITEQEGVERAGSILWGLVRGRYVTIERQSERFVIRDFHDGTMQEHTVPLERESPTRANP